MPLEKLLPSYRVCSLPTAERSQLSSSEVYLRIYVSIVDMCYLDPPYLLLHSGIQGWDTDALNSVVEVGIARGCFTTELELTAKGSAHISSLYLKVGRNLKVGSQEEKRVKTLLAKVDEMFDTYLQGDLLDAKEKLCLKLLCNSAVTHNKSCGIYNGKLLGGCDCALKDVLKFREKYKKC